jgi:hypothetical protein
MLFVDNEKFNLGQEELDQLRAVFPEFIAKKRPVSISYVDHKVSKLQTNNPTMPWVTSKPTVGIMLVCNWIDEETGTEREIRYTETAPKYLADGRKNFGAKNLVIDSSFRFLPEKHKELLWFCYNFGTSFENSLADNKNPVFKFSMPEKEAKQRTSVVFKDAKAKAAIGDLSKAQLIELSKNIGLNISSETAKDLVLSYIYDAMNSSEQIRIKLYEMFATSEISKISDMLQEAWNLDLIMPSSDGEKTVVIVEEKEVVLADLPIDDLDSIAEFLVKDKKALDLLQKAMS